MHLRPPGVVGVVDDEEDLAPQQHQGGVGGDQALHHVVQPLQWVKQVRLCTSTLALQKTACCDCDPAKHSCEEKESQRRGAIVVLGGGGLPKPLVLLQ